METDPEFLPGLDYATFFLGERKIRYHPIDRKDSYLAVIFFGHLVVLVVGTPVEWGLVLDDPLESRLTHIWPNPPKSLVWPVRPFFGIDEALGLADSALRAAFPPTTTFTRPLHP